MPARLRQIPDALWERLARLDGRFDFSLERRDANAHKGTMTTCRNYERCWVVRVINRADAGRTMTCEAPSLAMALKGAIEEAEARLSFEAPATSTRPQSD